MDYQKLFTLMNDEQFLEKLVDSPIDPNGVMKYEFQAPGGLGMQMPPAGHMTPAGTEGTGLQAPGVLTPAPTQAGQAGIVGDIGASQTPIDWAALAGAQGMRSPNPPQPQMAAPEMMRIGSAQPAQVTPFQAGPAPRQAPIGLGELLAQFKRG